MLSFLKLIRIQNLLIIAFTQYMVRWCLLYPIFKVCHYELQMSNFQFFLLSLSTVMIAAAGYAINDYFDVRIDKVNKPERMIIDKGIKRRVAIGAHTVMNLLAIIIGLYVSWAAGHWKFVFIFILCATGLWFYSTTFKRQFFIGNFVIALFTALVPLIVGIYELVAYYDKELATIDFRRGAWTLILALSFFAFITTLLREIIKDIEDYNGDKEYGCKTMPVIMGIKGAKNVAIAIVLATMFCLAYIQILYWERYNMLAFYYIMIGVQLPFCFLIYKTYKAETKKDYRIAGNTAKFIMLTGVCYLFVYAFTVLSDTI
jgi:4-hydroxybenzoate polyprenyltransferase